MADQRLINAFNDCIDRLANGETIAECLRRYPEYALDLRPMLEAGLLMRRAQSDSNEVLAAKARVRANIMDTLALTPMRRPTPPILRILPLVASLLIVFVFAIVGGSALLSRLNQAEPTPTTEFLSTHTVTPTLTATPTGTPTVTPTSTTTPTASSTPSSTPSPSSTPTETTIALPSTNTPRPSSTPVPTLTHTALPTNAITGCTVPIPAGWVIHRIQAGDTLSSLAVRGSTTVNEIMRVNCLTDARLLVIGQQVYVPPLVPPTQSTGGGTAPQVGGVSGNDNIDASGGGGSSGSSGGGNDNTGSDNGNDNADDHGGSGGGGGSGDDDNDDDD